MCIAMLKAGSVPFDPNFLDCSQQEKIHLRQTLEVLDSIYGPSYTAEAFNRGKLTSLVNDFSNFDGLLEYKIKRIFRRNEVRFHPPTGSCVDIAHWIRFYNYFTFMEAIGTKIPQALEFIDKLEAQRTDHSEKVKLIIDWLNEHSLDLKKITSLDLSHMMMTALPQEISLFINLEELNLDDNELKSLPTELLALENVKKVYIRHNLFEFIPHKVRKVCDFRKD